VEEDDEGLLRIKEVGERSRSKKDSSSSKIKAWLCPKYFAGDRMELYPIPPEDPEAEDWLPDAIFDEVVSRSREDQFSPLSPIRNLCAALGLFVSQEDYDPDHHYLLRNPELAPPRSSHRYNVIELLEQLGLLDYDALYSDGYFRYDLWHNDMGIYNDTFEQCREKIDPDDPRSFWLELGEMDNEKVGILRHRLMQLASESYKAGYEACRTEMLDKHKKALDRGGEMLKGPPKQGSTLTDHTELLEKVIIAYEKELKIDPSAAKVRNFISASGNDDWNNALEVAGFNSLKGLIKRHNDNKS